MVLKTNVDFEVISQLKSEGVNSKLFLVNDLQLDKVSILKRIDKRKIKNNDFFREYKKINELNHPNIIKITSTSYDEDYVYMTMPFFEKGSLNKLIKNKNLNIKEIKKYSLGFLSAISYIHKKGIIHGDIKPSNILIDDYDNAILTDFGSAVYMDTNGRSKIKNVYYKHIAPEQCKKSLIDKRVDIYQIGTTLYRMCNGDYEYNKQIKKYKNIEFVKKACFQGKFPIRKKYLPHIPKSMIYIIEKCIKLDKDERYNDVDEIIKDMNKVKDSVWNYKIISEYEFLWENNKNKINLYKRDNFWYVNYNGFIKIFESKPKSYIFIRSIIKEYEITSTSIRTSRGL